MSSNETSGPTGAQPRWGNLGTGWIADLMAADLKLTGHAVTAVGSRTTEGAPALR